MAASKIYNMRKVLLLIVVLHVGAICMAQSWTRGQYVQNKGVIADSAFTPPRMDTVWKGGNKDSLGAIVYRLQNHTLYIKKPGRWEPLANGVLPITMYTGNGTLSGNRMVNGAKKTLTFNNLSGFNVTAENILSDRFVQTIDPYGVYFRPTIANIDGTPVVINNNGTVSGADAVNDNEFVTKRQLSSSPNIYNIDGTLTSDRTLHTGTDVTLRFSGGTTGLSGGRTSSNSFRFNNAANYPIWLSSDDNVGNQTYVKIAPDNSRFGFNKTGATISSSEFLVSNQSAYMYAEQEHTSGQPFNRLEFVVDPVDNSYKFQKGSSFPIAKLYSDGRMQGAEAMNANEFVTKSQLSWGPTGINNISNLNSGNVGIGGAPDGSLKLHVHGYVGAQGVTVINPNSNGVLDVRGNNGGAITFSDYSSFATHGSITGMPEGLVLNTGSTSIPMIFSINHIEKARLTTDGSFGIGGTPDIGQKLHVRGFTKTQGLSVENPSSTGTINVVGNGLSVVSFNDFSSGSVIGFISGALTGKFDFNSGSSTIPVTLSVNSSEKVRVLNNGNVGIGTVAPSQKLEVSGSALINGVLYTSGAGNPEGSIAAPVGSWYSDLTNGLPYFKKTGTGNTGWKQITLNP